MARGAIRARRCADDPAEGWKLHVSATLLSALDVFARAQPVLSRHGALFKVPASLDVLIALNSGRPDFAQIGKFITVYPRSPGEAAAIARELHLCTKGLAGPRVPFDVPYRARSLVHYRYGSFRAGADGRRGVVFAGRRRAVIDRRASRSAVPAGLKNPFTSRSRARGTRFSLGCDYLPFRAISARGKGGVYEALDLTAFPPAEDHHQRRPASRRNRFRRT